MKKVLTLLACLFLFPLAAFAASDTYTGRYVSPSASCWDTFYYSCSVAADDPDDIVSHEICATISTSGSQNLKVIASHSPHDTDCFDDPTLDQCVEGDADEQDSGDAAFEVCIQGTGSGHFWVLCNGSSCPYEYSITIDCPDDTTPNTSQVQGNACP